MWAQKAGSQSLTTSSSERRQSEEARKAGPFSKRVRDAGESQRGTGNLSAAVARRRGEALPGEVCGHRMR